MEVTRIYGSEFRSFLQSLYAGTSCWVKVGDRQSQVLDVNVGLCQGCVLSPVLFFCT